jgi:hypothetical protein
MSGGERPEPPGEGPEPDPIERLRALLRETGAGSPGLFQRVESTLAGLRSQTLDRLGQDQLLAILSDLELLEVELGQELASLRKALAARTSFDQADRAYRGPEGGKRR